MRPYYLPYILAIVHSAGCHSNIPEKGITSGSATAQLKTAQAISCTRGMLPEDSSLYFKGGASDFQPTIPNKFNEQIKAPDGMVFIPGGVYSMGAPNPIGIRDGGDAPMDDCRPIHQVKVPAFFMDEHEVTNAEYEAFVKATGYVTIAEQTPTIEEFPGATADMLVAGSVVFSPPKQAVKLDNFLQWWEYKKGANWRHPLGAESSIAGKENYPVVHIAWDDAMAYAKWAGKRLPTEAEWEFAARGGLTGNMYSWGNQFRPEGKYQANSFQGQFPVSDKKEDGFAGVAPIKQFSPNGYGLYDIAGNVWEWCSDWYRHDYYNNTVKGKIMDNPEGPAESYDPAEPGVAKKVQRGGSFLCTDQYCTRYMMGTRGKGDWRTGTNHVGFRCVRSK